MKRRKFLISTAGVLAGTMMLPRTGATSELRIIKPPKLNPGDTIGLITPASSLFEPHQTLIEATEKITNLGFKVKTGKHIFKKWGYLAGTDEERVEDIHDMFADDEVMAVIAIRGGYGSGRLLNMLDFDLIRKNPKIIMGYSDITSLLIGIHQMTGLVTFHGPVAVSTFTEYTRKYMFAALTGTTPVGEIEDAPFSSNLQTTNRVWTINGGKSEGILTGGNLTLIAASLGTPYEIDTRDRILFVEETNEEPYDFDRMLTQLVNAGKFDQCRGVVFDRMEKVKPASLSPGFDTTLSKEDILLDRMKKYKMPVCLGLSLGHVADKPVLPLGVMAGLNADTGRISLLETAVL